MRRLQVLPCPESWERMRPDGDGRFCERCSLHVTDVASLDGEGGIERLLDAADGGRVCARFELERDQPRTRLGIAAGFVVVALAGCATPDPKVPAPGEAEFAITSKDDSGGMVSGVIRTTADVPIANALVILHSPALPHPFEVLTDMQGSYVFDQLPPGHYRVQVVHANRNANLSKVAEMRQGARFLANFAIDPKGGNYLAGAVSEAQMIEYCG